MEKKTKILVVRFKQIGDSVLASPICNTLKKTYPDSEIDYVVYEHIAPLFENHHAIDNVIAITKEEQKNPLKYIAKVWRVTRKKYDIIIDIMSTPKSELFTLFGRSAEYRIGRYKKKRGYTYTHKVHEPEDAKDKVDKFLRMLDPLVDAGVDVKYDSEYNIDVSPEERCRIREKMSGAGVDLEKPVVAFAINSRRPEKRWNIEYMKKLIEKILKEKGAQGIFYYSPAEREFALTLHREIGERNDIFTNIITKDIRELAALISECDMFIGNEGGPRHIAQGVDTPSVAIFSPSAEKKEWLSNANERHRGIEYLDVLSNDEIDGIMKEEESRSKLYDSIGVDDVYNLVEEVWKKADYDKKYSV